MTRTPANVSREAGFNYPKRLRPQKHDREQKHDHKTWARQGLGSAFLLLLAVYLMTYYMVLAVRRATRSTTCHSGLRCHLL